jgi:arylsulfatase A-like enzyme
MKKTLLVFNLALSFLCATNQLARAQEVLPKPAPPFNGQIGLTYKDSIPGKMTLRTAPAGAPNVLVILIDDAGFGQTGTFGGGIPTPTLDKLAARGLRYNCYHTTALCSPTRAAILTGRNHHSVGTGVITELATDFPGYTGIIPKSATIISEILRQNGYNTAAFGKWHNTPTWETSVSGPYDHWPTSVGFEKFYGFMGGESNQWQPALYDGTRPIELKVPPGQEGHYTLNDALADNAIDWIQNQKAITPNKPFFIYFAPGATHAPHHVPKEWIDKFKGQFDQGWDKYRIETFERQKKLGVIPQEAELTPRPPEIPAWDSLTPEQKRAASRLVETFAGYTAQTDYEVGRILNCLEQLGQLDNTLIFYEVGDNGASPEGGLNGVFNEMAILNGVGEDPKYLYEHLDEVGGPKAYNHYPVGWAWAMDTPFQWTKEISSHFGGTRNPLVVFYPKRIHDAGGLRSQFHHCIDMVPTILDVVGIQQPVSVNGVAQKPIEGVSMAYSFDAPMAKSPRTTQYFEMFSTRGVYHDGWIASTRHDLIPWLWNPNKAPPSFENDRWELYNVVDDFSEAHDLAGKFPDKVKELKDLFWVQAAMYNVLPLDDRTVTRLNPKDRISLTSGRTKFVYPGSVQRLPESSAPNTKNGSHTISADIVVPEQGADGVLAAEGGIVGGWTLYVKENVPVYEYNYLTTERYKIVSSDKLQAGPATVQFEFDYDGLGYGKGGTGKLYISGKKVGEGRIDRTVPFAFSADETFDVGRDCESPVGTYDSPFAFNGTVKKVAIEIIPNQLAPGINKMIEGKKEQIMQSSE